MRVSALRPVAHATTTTINKSSSLSQLLCFLHPQLFVPKTFSHRPGRNPFITGRGRDGHSSQKVFGPLSLAGSAAQSGGFPAPAVQILQHSTYYEHDPSCGLLQFVDPKLILLENEHAIESSPRDTPSGLGLGSDPQIEPDGSYDAAGDFVQFDDDLFPLSNSPSFVQPRESVLYSSTSNEPSGSPPASPTIWGLQLPPPTSQTPLQHPIYSNGYSSSTDQTGSLSSQTYQNLDMCATQGFAPIQTTATTGAAENESLPSMHPSQEPPTTMWDQTPSFTNLQPSTITPMPSRRQIQRASPRGIPASSETRCRECPRTFKTTRDLQ
jgi:hypothetical protein